MTLRLIALASVTVLLHGCCLPFGGSAERDDPPAPAAPSVPPASPLPPLAPVSPPPYYRPVQGSWGSMWIPESFMDMPVTDPNATVRWESPSLRTSLQLFRYAVPPGEPPALAVPHQVPPALSAGGSPSAYAIDIGGVQGQRWDLSGFDAEQYSRRGYAVRWDYGGHRYVAICDSTYGDAPIDCLLALATLRPPG